MVTNSVFCHSSDIFERTGKIGLEVVLVYPFARLETGLCMTDRIILFLAAGRMLSCGDRINTLLCLIPANRLLSSSITEIPCNSLPV